MGHHLDFGSLVLHHFLMQMSFVISRKGIHAQGIPDHLQVMDLQIEALQNFAYKILTWKSEPSLKEVRNTIAS